MEWKKKEKELRKRLKEQSDKVLSKGRLKKESGFLWWRKREGEAGAWGRE